MATLRERTYVNADRTRIVAEDSPDAAYLLGGEGDEVSDEDAKRYGIKAPKSEPEEGEAPKSRGRA
jgi:hypothetical protein